MAKNPIKTLHKTPGESLKCQMDLVNLMATGETISSVSGVTADQPDGAAALTISEITSSGTIVQFRVGIGGTNLFTYHVTATVVTTDGNTRQGCGELEVAAC